jgi:hypothetical protein
MSKYVLVHWTSRAKKTPVYGPFPDVKAAYKFKDDNRSKIPGILYFNPHVLIEPILHLSGDEITAVTQRACHEYAKAAGV